MTIFGVPWDNLGLKQVERFLADADAEPLLWEAKGTRLDKREIRRQVCGFANSHEGGFLILGASQSESAWELDGVEFPGDDPPAWISRIIRNGGVTPYPDGLDTWSERIEGSARRVAIVRIPSTATPPCNTYGVVYERVSGETIPVREPLRLAALFERGDAAKKRADELAHWAAEDAMSRGLQHRDHSPDYPQFALGIAASGYEPDIASRLFSRAFEEAILAAFARLLQTDILQPQPGPHSRVTQDSCIYESERKHPLGYSWSLRATWNGALGIWWTVAAQQHPEQLVPGPVLTAWSALGELLTSLGGKEPHYVALTVAGGPFPSFPAQPEWIGRPPPYPTVSRGPLAGAVTDATLASVTRELRRALGEMVHEPDPTD